MASGSFLDTRSSSSLLLPLLAPVVSSTATLLYAHDQTLFLSILTHPTLSRPQSSRAAGGGSNALIPAYWHRLFVPGLVRVLGFLSITTTSVLTLYVKPSHREFLRQRGSLGWYLAAAGWAASHLLFVPLVAPKLQSMLDDEGGDVDVGEEEEEEEEKKKKAGQELDVEAQNGTVLGVKDGSKSNVAVLRDWLRVHGVRTWTVDLAAWACALVAVSKTFKVQV